MYVCIYIYIYVYTHMYIYIYMYMLLVGPLAGEMFTPLQTRTRPEAGPAN